METRKKCQTCVLCITCLVRKECGREWEQVSHEKRVDDWSSKMYFFSWNTWSLGFVLKTQEVQVESKCFSLSLHGIIHGSSRFKSMMILSLSRIVVTHDGLLSHSSGIRILFWKEIFSNQLWFTGHRPRNGIERRKYGGDDTRKNVLKVDASVFNENPRGNVFQEKRISFYIISVVITSHWESCFTHLN